MLELIGRKQNLILDPPIIPAPGVWAPDSQVVTEGLGALCTPPLGWTWDGDAASFAQRPGGFVWMPPRRPIDRTFRRLQHEHLPLSLIVTLAPDEPRALADAAEYAEEAGAGAILLWDGPTGAQVRAVATTTLLPLMVEYPAGTEPAPDEQPAAIVVGPPRTRLHDAPARLWGPAVLPLVCDALRDLRDVGVPLIAGAGLGDDPRDIELLREAGAAGLCVGPERWVSPESRVEW